MANEKQPPTVAFRSLDYLSAVTALQGKIGPPQFTRCPTVLAPKTRVGRLKVVKNTHCLSSDATCIATMASLPRGTEMNTQTVAKKPCDSQGSAVPAVKPVQVARVSCAGAVQDRQPDLHQPRRQSALQFLAPYSPVTA